MEYDSTYVSDLSGLRSFLKEANKNHYEIISVTEKYGYTIIYKRSKNSYYY